jgi:hypothetical protein
MTAEGDRILWRKRACRARKVRAVTLSIRMMKATREPSDEEAGEYNRPRVRVECEDGPRPCPFVSCKHNLFLDVSPTVGSIKFNFPDLELWEMGQSCALDVAAQGGLPLEAVAAIMNLTRERVRQLEALACRGISRTLRGHR